MVHGSRNDFLKSTLNYLKISCIWCPPSSSVVATYRVVFQGSVRLHAMNDLPDAEFLTKYDLPVCLDLCHMIMGRNCFHFSAPDLISDLAPLVRHIHLADAAGIDGEGLAFGDVSQKI